MNEETWDEALTQWREHLRAAGAPATTLRLRNQHVAQLRRESGIATPWAASDRDLVRWMGAHIWAHESRAAARASLRSFYAWGAQTGRIGASPAAGLPRVRRRPPTPHPLPDRLMADLLERAGQRETLMVSLAVTCGLRRGEIAQVHSRDLREDLVGWSLLVHGKGARERVVPLPDELAARLRGCGPGYAFPGKVDGHLSAGRVGELVGDLLPPGWTLHSLRHRFASRAYQATGDLLAVQQLLGHSTPTTTQIYVRLPDDSLCVARSSPQRPEPKPPSKKGTTP